MSIRVLVADDQQMVREGLAQMFKEEDIEIVAEATTGKETLELVDQHQPDVVLLDVRMPEGDGLNTLGRVRLEYPELPILMFSHFDNASYVARAAALGANGYVLKGVSRKELIDAIQTAAKGGTTWTREQLRRVSGALTSPRVMKDIEAPLSDREIDVLRQMAEGQTNQQIAETLNISYETVKEHIQQLLRKIGVTDRTQAAVWAVRKGLI
ncbi:MAG TPA: response regulator transcription factor [Planctomycetaceae bacterium]|nr:response regulator transcription factor [Planctomycetaceae bacterium]HIQ21439.1 response regulator transcription factor [Planctomycetota bacterium]